MQPQENRPPRRSVNQPLINRLTETGYHNNRNHKGKEQVEVAVDQPISTQDTRHGTHNRLLAHRSHSTNLQIIHFNSKGELRMKRRAGKLSNSITA
jgi:hypothetical protein